MGYLKSSEPLKCSNADVRVWCILISFRYWGRLWSIMQIADRKRSAWLDSDGCRYRADIGVHKSKWGNEAKRVTFCPYVYISMPCMKMECHFDFNHDESCTLMIIHVLFLEVNPSNLSWVTKLCSSSPTKFRNLAWRLWPPIRQMRKKHLLLYLWVLLLNIEILIVVRYKIFGNDGDKSN